MRKMKKSDRREVRRALIVHFLRMGLFTLEQLKNRVRKVELLSYYYSMAIYEKAQS